MYNYDPKQEIIEIDNFFPKYTQKEVFNIFKNSEINWKHLPSLSYKEKNEVNSVWTDTYIQESYGFASPIDKEGPFYKPITRAVTVSLKNFLNINVTEFLRFMVVLTPPNPFYAQDCYLTPHVDNRDALPYKNLLYYVDDNDAETIFFNQMFDRNKPIDYSNQEIIHRVKPKQGTAVIWNGSIFHAGSVSRTHTRCTLNIVFK